MVTSQEFVQAADGTQVATWTALPEGAPRALVQIAHGAAEHSARYTRFAEFLTAHGFAVTASDHRGHGATAPYTGGRGVAGDDAWRRIVADLKTVADHALTGLPAGTPHILLGHSMGSQLARDYAQEHGSSLHGLLLSGTFRSLPGCETVSAVRQLEKEISRQGRGAVSDFVPTLFGAFNAPYRHRTGYEWLSRDPAEVDRYAADEDCGFAFSAGLALDWVLGIRKINDPEQLARIPRGLPVHVAVGDQDPCHSGMTLVYELLEDLRYQGIKPLTWHAYPGARHEILNETNREEVRHDLLEWLRSLV